jgi:hypothetical protein
MIRESRAAAALDHPHLLPVYEADEADGTKVKAELIAALSSSLEADRNFLTWARQQLAGGCIPSGQSSAYNAAFSASQLADAAKQEFVQVWNPVAAR